MKFCCLRQSSGNRFWREMAHNINYCLMGLPSFQLIALNTSIPIVCFKYVRILLFNTTEKWNRVCYWSSDKRPLEDDGCSPRYVYPVYIRFCSLFIYCYWLLEGVLLKTEEILTSFIRSGILDFLGTIISSSKDNEILVLLLSLLFFLLETFSFLFFNNNLEISISLVRCYCVWW